MSTMQGLREIEYSEEEAMLAQSASELLAERSDMGAVRRQLDSPHGYDEELYARMAQLGWLGVALPEAHGGAGLHVGALVSVAEAMGRHLTASPFLATTLAAQALSLSGSAAQKAAWLPKFSAGQAVGSIAICEADGSYGLVPTLARAARSGKGLSLSGKKTFVLHGERADVVLVAVRLDDRPALLLLDAAALAGRTRREVLIDETQRSARIDLDGLELPSDALLEGADALATLQHVQRVAWLLLAADMAGGAEAVMQLTLDYLRTRKQFGKPIGAYQALKHPMVEIACAVEQGRSLLYHAATAFERKDPEREIALRMAKAQLGDTYAHAADRAIQFHGAIGFTYECHAQLFFRRAQWAQYSFGDSAHHRQRLSSLLWPAR
jgi:acyl-CoA dehydrogenase